MRPLRRCAIVLEGLDDWGLAGTRAASTGRTWLLTRQPWPCSIGPAWGLVGGIRDQTGRNSVVVVMIRSTDQPTQREGSPGCHQPLCALDADGPRAAWWSIRRGVRFEALRGGGARGTASRSAIGLSTLDEAIVAFSGYPPSYSDGRSIGDWVRPPSTSVRWPMASSTPMARWGDRRLAVGTTWGDCWSAWRPGRSSPTPGSGVGHARP